MNRIATHAIYAAISLTVTLGILASTALIAFIFSPGGIANATALGLLPALAYGYHFHREFITKDKEARASQE